MALTVSGGALSYDYGRLSNKIAHFRVLSSFPCGGYKLIGQCSQAQGEQCVGSTRSVRSMVALSLRTITKATGVVLFKS
jgi:hypothetical protein